MHISISLIRGKVSFLLAAISVTIFIKNIAFCLVLKKSLSSKTWILLSVEHVDLPFSLRKAVVCFTLCIWHFSFAVTFMIVVDLKVLFFLVRELILIMVFRVCVIYDIWNPNEKPFLFQKLLFGRILHQNRMNWHFYIMLIEIVVFLIFLILNACIIFKPNVL